MSRASDEFRSLKRVWRDLEAPPAFRELDEESRETRAAVSWLQSAYRNSSPAPPQQVAQQPTRLRQVVALAVAASLLSFTIRFIWKVPSASRLARSPAPTPIYHADQGQLELRSGPVRLLFIDTPK